MRRLVDLRRVWLVSLAAVSLLAYGCDDEDDTGTDTGNEDTGGGDGGGEDTPGEDTPGEDTPGEDTPGEDTTGEDTETDTPEEQNFCANDTDGAAITDLGDTLGEAVGAVAQDPCLACGSSDTTCGADPPDGDCCNCGVGVLPADCDIAACVVHSINSEPDDGDAGILAVQDSGISEDCLGCYGGVPACIITNGCTLACATILGGDPDSCECQLCQCDGGCPEAFDSCSGLGPHITPEECTTFEGECGE